MRHDTVPYDEATWAVDEALVRAASADATGAIRLVSDALAMVDRAPYPVLVRDARRFGDDAARGLRDGDGERAVEYLLLLRHVVDDMGRFEAAELATA
jgi:hypothetical protein